MDRIAGRRLPLNLLGLADRRRVGANRCPGHQVEDAGRNECAARTLVLTCATDDLDGGHEGRRPVSLHLEQSRV